ncbi:MAG TPA: SHOCT domain-containing protein [Anaerolineae bacterium]|nr:SHOCT domain-containing protein [Anaerolineae bacterium]
MRNSSLVIGAVILIVLLVVLLGGIGMMGFGGFGMGPEMIGGIGMHGFGGTFGYSPFGLVVPLAFLGLLIGGIVLVVVSLARTSRAPSAVPLSSTRSEALLDILRAQYARGEITKEQFNEIKKDLDG